jgi:hypothetical protein
MLEISTNLLEQALAEALETMAFISPLPPEDDAPPAAGPAVLTRLEYRGAASGAIELACPAAFGKLVAANLLGCDPDDPDAEQRAADALRELLNITCGSLLRRSIAADAELVEMSVPTQTTFDLEGWQAFVAAGATVVDGDGHKLAIRLVELP